jgi:anti-sigma regulatory factor (Ser/Thr protein kinase)
MGRQRADWVLEADAQSIGRARTLIAQTLGDLPAESLEVVLLLTSELVTNAVRHGAGPVGLHVVWGDGAVRVEVADQSPERPVVRAVDRDALNGRGLILVDGLSTGWGVLAGRPGKTVWFTLDA